MATAPNRFTDIREFRKRLLGEEHLTPAERGLVLDQAQELIDNVYVHRPHKSAMYGVNVSQQLRLLRRRLPSLKDAAFHYELLRVLDGLRDMHTTYVLPKPYHKVALLGVVLERYWDGERYRYIVSKTNDGVYDDDRLTPGVEVTYWNGMPIEAAVERNAEVEAGGNPAARRACGMESLTIRSLAQSPLPAEDWVDLECHRGDKTWTSRLHWKVTDQPVSTAVPSDGAEGRRLGLSRRTEFARHTKIEFFTGRASGTPDDEITFEDVDTGDLAKEVSAKIVRIGEEEYGYLRIYTFLTTSTVDKFVGVIRDLLGILPQRGLIVDVRANGGGYIPAAEAVLQFLTDRPIQTQPMQFISSDATVRLCAAVDELRPWQRSLDEAGETGEQYSAALPLYANGEFAGRPGVYGGEVVLVTDALCYSATDIFAAGFQDHRIGTVLGIDDNTGAGGANRWDLEDLRTDFPAGPFRALPQGAQLTVALRRSLRVGAQAGRPVEDLGVRPDVLYRMTHEDLLSQNRGLVRRAVRLLEQQVRSATADRRQGER